MGYQYLIFDMGSFGETDLQEFLRCDRKFILGTLAPWKARSIQEFFQYMNDNIESRERFFYIVQTECTKNLLSFAKNYQLSGRSMFQSPFIKNPFYIEKELFLFFQALLSAQ